MNHFTIKDIENLSGIKAHTLRIWEQRYQLFVPKRKESKHRYYDNEDLKHILRISQLYHNGVKISKIARLSDESIRSMTLGEEDKQSAGSYVHQLVEASIDFDEEAFEHAINKAFKQFGFEYTILNIVYVFLERVGLLWLTDHMIPAQEHFASNIIRRKIIAQIEMLKAAPLTSTDTYVLFTLEGEHHEIPLLLTHYLMKASGKRCIYMGIDLPFSDLKAYVMHKKPSHLYFHAITHLTEQSVDDWVTEISQLFKEQQIIMAGPLTKDVSQQHKNVRILYSLREMLEFTKNL
jgi:MerR family transcriptional regulator, light-induced transcriptional regulator